MENKRKRIFYYFCMVGMLTLTLCGCGKEKDDAVGASQGSEQNSEQDKVWDSTESTAYNTTGSLEQDTTTSSTEQSRQDAGTYKPADGSNINYETNTMQIYDEEEGYLMVPFDSTLPQHTYDWSFLKEENGFRTYEEAGVVSSVAGIDVSKFQGTIDWQQVADSGVSFVIVRLGYRGYGNGALMLDERMEQNITGALEAGLEVGVYFFSQAVSEEEALEEAEFVLAEVEKYDITYPIVFDTEEIKNDTARTDNLTVEELTFITKTFCNAVEDAGYQPMIYANAKWLTTKLALTELQEIPVWYADYQEIPLYPYPFSMWQYSETGTVPGIDGAVDLNLYLKKVV